MYPEFKQNTDSIVGTLVILLILFYTRFKRNTKYVSLVINISSLITNGRPIYLLC